MNVDAVRVRRSAGDLDLPLQPTAAAPAASSRSADGVDLAAQERLTARHIEATCCNPAVELPESCVAFEQSVSGTFNDRASSSQDAVILLSPNDQSAPTLFVTINKGALSLLCNFFRTDKVFNCEKKWLRLGGLEQPLELIELSCTEPHIIATAMHLCHWVNDCPEADAWPKYADSFDKRTCLSVMQAVDQLSCNRPGSSAQLVQARLWSMVERKLVSALCDCAVSGVFNDDEGGRMLLLTVSDRNEGHTSNAYSDEEVTFDRYKLDKLVDDMNQDISSLPESSPLRNKLAKCCQRVLAACTSRKDLATADRLIDKLPVELRDLPAAYFATSPAWMMQGYHDGGCSHALEYGHLVTAEADQEDPITCAMINREDDGDWFVQSRTYTHPHKAGYQMISLALVKS